MSDQVPGGREASLPAEPAESGEPVAAGASVVPGAPGAEERWYIVHTYVKHEDRVKARLDRLIAAAPTIQKAVRRVLIPTEDVVEIKKNQRRIMKRNFFPGYLFLEMDLTDEVYWAVRNVPGVTGFLGGVKPAPLAREEMSSILDLANLPASAKPKPAVMFDKDEQVRIVEGPFANFVGIVDEVNVEKARLRVMVTIFGRATPVELDFLQVEKL